MRKLASFQWLIAPNGKHLHLAQMLLGFCALGMDLGANSEPNAICGTANTAADYSNLRISTGRSREASRAGMTVARTAMAMAARAIHKPSKKLG